MAENVPLKNWQFRRRLGYGNLEAFSKIKGLYVLSPYWIGSD